MLEYIEKNFKLNSDKVLGENLKYHTVYYILFENGKYYIGKHSSKDVDNDEYFCSSKLAQHLKDIGEKYNRKILSYLYTAKDAIDLETHMLSNKKIYENDNCLNCYPGSHPDASNSIIVSLKNRFKMINPKLLEYYLELGWERKGIKMFWMYHPDHKHNKRIIKDKIDYYLEHGWKLGTTNIKNRIFIKKDNKQKFIVKDFLEEYLKDGWRIHHPHIDKIVIEKNNKRKFIKQEDLMYYSSDGWVRSSTVRGLKYIVKNKKLKRVNQNELTQYLNDGWKIGNNKSDQCYINNGIIEKRIYIEDLKNYPDFSKGRLKYVRLTNGVETKQIYVKDINILQQYLNDGWIRGCVLKNKKCSKYDYIVGRNNESRYILEKSLLSYLNNGWCIIQKNILKCV